MQKISFCLLLLASGLYAACNNYDTLGQKVSKGLEDLPSIVWHKKGVSFTLEPMECQKSGYMLLHDNEKKYSKKEYIQNSYTLQRGWNFVHAPKDGVDVAQTFGTNSAVLFVYIYEPNTPAWAGYSAHESYRDMMRLARILALEYIEPSLGFYVYANKKITLPIVATSFNQRCKDLLKTSYKMLKHSAFYEESRVKDEVGSVSLATLYRPHYRRGIYSDTRVMLLYPTIDVRTKKQLRYAPIEPRADIKYTKEYEEKTFYVFDYKTKSCYEGVFPSKRIPPYPVLKKLQ